MAAPSGTVWGSIAGGYGRIGLHPVVSHSETTTKVTVGIWFWSKYSVSDSSNKMYFDFDKTSASTSRGSKSISTSVASGSGWSSSNQKKLGEYSKSYTKSTSAVTKYMAVKLTGVDRVGSTMTCKTSITVPALASYKVTYNANGGTGAPAAQVKWYGKAITLSTVKPTRTGYTFLGWSLSSTATSASYAPGITWSANNNANYTLYAVWKIITYTVDYDANGGSGAPASQTKNYGATLTLSTTKPTRTKYNFLGWGTSSSSTTVAYTSGASYTANASSLLYAIWELSYVAPRITNLTVERCTSNGTASDSGAYAKVKFNWACDQTVTALKIDWKLSTANSYGTAVSISSSGTSGSAEQIINGSFDAEKTYDIRVIVSDALGTTNSQATLMPMFFIMDIMSGGNGMALGKTAEISDFLDVGWKTRFRKNIVMNNGTGANGSGVIYGEDPTTGADIAAFQPQNENGNLTIGHGLYGRKSGNTNLYSGNNFYMISSQSSTSIMALYGETGRINIYRQNDIGINLKHSSSGKGVGIGIGSGGDNRGIWDTTGGNWIIHRNSSNTTVVTTSSDARLKENLGEIPEEEMYALLSGMVPINFIYKGDENKVIQNGFIAQNVRDVLIDNDIGYRSYLQITEEQEESYDLNTPEEDVRYGLDYSKFTPLLVAGWQYHEKKIKELEEKIMTLEKRLGRE